MTHATRLIAGGGFLPERGFGHRVSFCWRGFLAGGGFLPERGFGRRVFFFCWLNGREGSLP